ncbi:MAG: hypothetical protein FVQ83_04550 [Chloroflexi bacterium]|nr:hypothetical protein [Chloroflexota bacterium]
MLSIRLIHWNAEEAEERAERLCTAGYEVEYAPTDTAEIRAMRDAAPSAAVIDLGRLPAQGRDVGMMLRKYKDTRHVPLVFVGGDPEKVARIREMLPDAVYTTWDDMPNALMDAKSPCPQRSLWYRNQYLRYIKAFPCPRSWESKRTRLSSWLALRMISRLR